MMNTLLSSSLEQIKRRSLDQGGFESQSGEGYRPDATAWAVLVLNAYQPDSPLLEPARIRLTEDQLPDGRVSLSHQHPDAWWPTPLAILAWHDSPSFHESQRRSIQFLLNSTGVHWKNGPNDLGHDLSIIGWSWIAQTHSWVQPTALAIIALTTSGYRTDERVKEGERLLINRQLPHGGWNYGNTIVFGQELRPFPESTGIALTALAGRVSKTKIIKSLDYLSAEIPKLRTPLSLGWGLMGLAAWGIIPAMAKDWIQETFDREARYGTYDTSSLCLLLLVLLTIQGYESFLMSGQYSGNVLHPNATLDRSLNDG